MIEFKFLDKSNLTDNLVVALGFFDSLHLGHRYLINNAKKIARTSKMKLAVLTFSNNPYKVVGKQQQLICSFDERKIMLEQMGVDILIKQEFNEHFMHLSKDYFLHKLFENFCVKHIVCGEDYSFGKNKEGDVCFLRDYAKNNGIMLSTYDFLKSQNSKISTSQIRELLKCGEIEKANKLLGYNFTICESVVSGFKVGRTLGFPTANLKYPQDKVLLKPAVYVSKVEIEGNVFWGISNVGNRPTFSQSTENKIETYIDGFSDDIYGKVIKIEFLKRIRDIEKFQNKEQLIAQLEKDKKFLKTFNL